MPSQTAATPMPAAAAAARAGPRASRSAVAAVWLGILLAYDSVYWPPAGRGWPVSFFVVTLIVGGYLVTFLRRDNRRAPQELPDAEQACSPA